MIKATFALNETCLPVTPKQFEDLTNEILVEINALMQPNNLDAEVMASIVMSAIHSLPKNKAVIKKSDLFEMCVCRISMKMTYDIVAAIYKSKGNKDELLGEEISPVQTDEGIGPVENFPVHSTNEQTH